jgi:hypothetical protein
VLVQLLAIQRRDGAVELVGWNSSRGEKVAQLRREGESYSPPTGEINA